MLKLPFSWLAFSIHSDIHLVHTIRILVCGLITRSYIPIVGTLIKCFRIRTCKSQLTFFSQTSFRTSTANAKTSNSTINRTIHLLRLTKLINTHHLSMSSKRSRNLYHIYSITFIIIPLLLELEHSIIIIYLIFIKSKKVTSEIETLSINTTFKAIRLLSIPFLGCAAATS